MHFAVSLTSWKFLHIGWRGSHCFYSPCLSGYNWYLTYVFKVCNVKIWYRILLQIDHHDKVKYSSIASPRYPFSLLFVVTEAPLFFPSCDQQGSPSEPPSRSSDPSVQQATHSGETASLLMFPVRWFKLRPSCWRTVIILSLSVEWPVCHSLHSFLLLLLPLWEHFRYWGRTGEVCSLSIHQSFG